MQRNTNVSYPDDQPFAAQHAPVAPFTWEVQAILDRTEARTARIPIGFRGPVEILGFFPTVIPNTAIGGALLVPTPDDLAVVIDINQSERLTNRLEATSVAGPGESFVTLSALSVQAPRLHRVQILNASPDVGVLFAWKRFTAGVPLYEDALIALAFYCRYLDVR